MRKASGTKKKKQTRRPPRRRSRKRAAHKPLPAVPDTSSFETAAAQIAAWKAKLKAPDLSTGGHFENPPVPLGSFPRRKPRPDLSKWDEPQLDPLTTPPDLEGLEDDEAVELIKAWFLSNYEDPANETPRDDGEFVYIWGGPYDARDVIGDAFGAAASEELIDAAVRAVEADGTMEWAPHGNRQQPPEDEEEPTDPQSLHAEMLRRIEALEAALAQVRPVARRGIGDNNPPEPIDASESAPISEADRQLAEAAITVLKQQPPEPVAGEGTDRALDAAKALATVAEHVRMAAASAVKYAGKQADDFVSEVVKTAASEMTKWGIRLPVLWILCEKLLAASNIALKWLASLGITF